MIKKLILGILVISVFNTNSSSQNINKFEFVGTLTVSGGEKMSYKISFNHTSNNKIKGYSITDFTGDNLTRTSIVGEYDTINSRLSFNELSNISTKLDVPDSTFCYVSAKKLKIADVNGSKMISGEFKGFFPSGESCANGKIFLMESKVVEKILSVTDKEKTRQDSLDRVKPPVEVLNKNKKLVLKSNDELFFEYSGNELLIEFWDGAVVDNDMISIYLNDEILKDNITLKREKGSISIPIIEDTFKLKIVALNEGAAGINSVNFTVKNVIGEKEFSSLLNKGESFIVDFRVKR